MKTSLFKKINVLFITTVLLSCALVLLNVNNSFAEPQSDLSSKSYSTITYDANGANSGMCPEAQSKMHDICINLSENTGNLCKENYDFVGWNTEKDGSGVHYDEGQSCDVNHNIVLYAEWLDPDSISGTVSQDFPFNKCRADLVNTRNEVVQTVDVNDFRYTFSVKGFFAGSVHVYDEQGYDACIDLKKLENKSIKLSLAKLAKNEYTISGLCYYYSDVFYSKTKHPLDHVDVQLFDADTGKVIGATCTEREGIYSFKIKSTSLVKNIDIHVSCEKPYFFGHYSSGKIQLNGHNIQRDFQFLFRR